MVASAESCSPEVGAPVDPAGGRLLLVGDAKGLVERPDAGVDPDSDLERWVASELDRLDAGGSASDGSVVAVVHRPHGDPGVDLENLSLCAARLDPGHEDRRVFTADTIPTPLRLLRQWASQQVRDLGANSGDVVLALSELATNAERYAPGWLEVDLVRAQGVLLAAVTDRQPTILPRPRWTEPDELTGRGLLVVATLSLAWGVVVQRAEKSVWAAFALDPR